jgi:hypothetical protein
MNQVASKPFPMKYQISLFLSITAIASAADSQTTNGVLPPTESLQAKIRTDRYDWSKTWTNLTVKKGGCPPWGCSFPSMILVIDPAKETHHEFVKRLRETDTPRLPTRPAFSNAFSVAIPPALKPFRTAR